MLLRLVALCGLHLAAAAECSYSDAALLPPGGLPCTWGGPTGCVFDKTADGTLVRSGSCPMKVGTLSPKRKLDFSDTLDLSGKGITAISKDAFADLSHTRQLRLSGNKIKTLPSEVLHGLPALEVLWISDNDLATLPAGLFDKNPALHWIDASSNELTSLPAGLFDLTPNLWAIYLHMNKFRSLPKGLFDKTGLFNSAFPLRYLLLWCPFSSSTMSCGTDDSPDLTCVPLSSWQLSFFPLLAVGGRETYKGPIQQCSPSPSPPTPPTPTPPWPPWNPVPPAPVPPGPSDPIIPSTTPLPGGGRGESTMVAEGLLIAVVGATGLILLSNHLLERCKRTQPPPPPSTQPPAASSREPLLLQRKENVEPRSQSPILWQQRGGNASAPARRAGDPVMQRAERAMGILDGFVQRSQTGRPPRVIARGGGDFAPARTQAALTSPPRSPERRAVSPPRSPQRLLPQQWRDVSPLGARRLPASQEAWQEQRRGRSPPRSGSPFGSRGAGPGALQTSDDDRMRLQRQGLSQLADADRHAKNGDMEAAQRALNEAQNSLYASGYLPQQ